MVNITFRITPQLSFDNEVFTLNEEFGFQAVVIYTQTLTDTLTLTDTFTGSITGKILTETLALTDTIIRTVGRTLTEMITLTDIFIRQIQMTRVLTETLNFLDISLSFVLNKVSSGIKKTIISLFKGEFFGGSREVSKPEGV